MTNTKSQKNWLIAALIFTAVSLGIHCHLSMNHYQLKLGLSAEKSECNINSTFNCDAVAASPYSSIFGVPVANFGIMIHAALFILLLTALLGLSSDNSRIKRYSFFLGAVTAVTSIIMGTISATMVGAYCLYCMAAYLLSFLNFVAIYKIQDQSKEANIGSDFAALFTSFRWVGVVLILVPALGFLSNSVILDSYGGKNLNLIVSDSVAGWQANPVQTFSPEGLTFQKGTGEPKMTIVEFADFRCSHCKMAYPSLHAFSESRSDVRLIYKFFPLDGKCNKALDHEGDGLTCKLAASAYCAEKVLKKGWDVHHWIFDHQEKLSTAAEFPSYLEQISADLNIDGKSLQSCIDSDEAQAALLATAKEGQEAKVQGTPSIFVNGKQLNRGQTLPVLEEVYKSLK